MAARTECLLIRRKRADVKMDNERQYLEKMGITNGKMKCYSRNNSEDSELRKKHEHFDENSEFIIEFWAEHIWQC